MKDYAIVETSTGRLIGRVKTMFTEEVEANLALIGQHLVDDPTLIAEIEAQSNAISDRIRQLTTPTE